MRQLLVGPDAIGPALKQLAALHLEFGQGCELPELEHKGPEAAASALRLSGTPSPTRITSDRMFSRNRWGMPCAVAIASARTSEPESWAAASSAAARTA